MTDADDERRRLNNCAQIVCDEARRIASAFSRRIPLGTSVNTDAGIVGVETNKDIAPNGYPFEYGVMHPLNRPKSDPRKHWYRQPYRPYLVLGWYKRADTAAEEYAKVIDDWCKRRGFTAGP